MTVFELFKPVHLLEETGFKNLFGKISVEPDQILVKQNENSTNLFVIKNGQYIVTDDRAKSRELALLGEDSIFGEMSFLNETPRSATVKALTAGEVFILPRNTMMDILDQKPLLGARFLMSLSRLLVERLRKADDLQIMMSDDKDLKAKYELKNLRRDIRSPGRTPVFDMANMYLTKVCNWIYTRKDQILIQQHDCNNDLFVVNRGKVNIIDEKHDNFVLVTLGKNGVFGEKSFLDDKPRSTTVSVLSTGEVLQLSRETLLKLLLKEPQIGTKLILNLGQLLAYRLNLANDFLSLLADDELREKHEVRMLMQGMRNSLRIHR